MYLFSQLLVVDAVVLHNRKRKELNLNLCLSLSHAPKGSSKY